MARKGKIFRYVLSGTEYSIRLFKNKYTHNGSLAVYAETNEGEPFMTITTNLPESEENVGTMKAYVKNDGPLLHFLAFNNIGALTGKKAYSGFNEYVEFLFGTDVFTEDI